MTRAKNSRDPTSRCPIRASSNLSQSVYRNRRLLIGMTRVMCLLSNDTQ